MDDSNNIDIRSEEVQEILGTPPSYLVTWGSSIAFFAVLVLGWASYFIKYPDTVQASIMVSASDPPRRLIADEYKYIERILVRNEEEVEADEALAVFKSDGEFADVMTLENYLLQYEDIDSDTSLLDLNIPSDLVLGPLQDAVFNFKEKKKLLQSTLADDSEEVNQRQIDRQIKQLQNGISSQRKQKARLDKEIDIAEKDLTRAQNLYKQGRLGIAEVRNNEAKLLSKERELSAVNSSIKEDQLEVELLKDRKNGDGGSSSKDIRIKRNQLVESFNRLRRELIEWKKEYLLSSPIHGIVLIKDGIGDNQVVKKETELMVVMPTETKETRGKMELPIEGSGKLQTGQRVVIKLASYPFEEFGAFEGEVSKIGRIPTDGKIPVEVSFPQGALVSSTGNQIEVTQQMAGSADIIVERKRLIEQLLEEVRKVIN
ncbi:MAG: HlyD family secretion protein [Saprospiraceae bacterium]|nr:HlyD family secretion protein [Saprospiraceae bacterium]